jgi:N utilization substance protein B
MGARRQGREGALRALYFLDVNPELTVGEGLRRFFDLAAHAVEEAGPPLEPAARDFCERLVRGTWDRRDELDALIRRYSKSWRLERMATVDRNLLRLAAYELTAELAPPPVVIDEAVELAKRYGGESSPAFVNGILDRIAAATETA